MQIHFAFGKHGLDLTLPDGPRYEVIESRSASALPDVKGALDAALDRPSAERTAFLENNCADSELRAEVTALLSALDEAGSRYDIFAVGTVVTDSGGGYRITNTQQIDFHIAFGLNDNAPSYIFGIGYSFRFDRLF